MPPTTNPPAPATACFGRVSVVRIAAAASAPPSGGERCRRVLQPGAHAVERQVHADHAGGEDDDLLDPQVEQERGVGRGRERVELPALARSPRWRRPR